MLPITVAFPLEGLINKANTIQQGLYVFKVLKLIMSSLLHYTLIFDLKYCLGISETFIKFSIY